MGNPPSSPAPGAPSKLRILFVDDQPLILEAQRRMLRHMRGRWDMAFALSGPEALEQMAKKPFDVVVSDMRMPGMNGAQLLNEIMVRYPMTIRFVLSGFADLQLIRQCVGTTHQYLAKPCDPDYLVAAVTRATSFQHLALGNPRVQKLFARIDRIPSVPSTYLQLVKLLEAPEASLDAVEELIARDIGMTARVLQLVNSAFFGNPRPTSNIQEALSFLGLDNLKSLVLTHDLFHEAEPEPDSLPLLEKIWDQACRTGFAAEAITRQECKEPGRESRAFEAGLLLHAGTALLAANFPEAYAQTLKQAIQTGQDVCELEQQAFGVSHPEISSHLLSLWGLPHDLIEAVAWYRAPGKAPSRHDRCSPLASIHISSALLEDGPIQPIPLDEPFLQSCGLELDAELWKQAIRANPTGGSAS